MMIQGIPYFGDNTQELYEQILNSNIQSKKEYKSLYEMIETNINKHIVVIIDNKWLTWLNDIVFNYRDKKCYIPYYTYDIFEIPDRSFRTNNKGHMIINDSTLRIRYNYKYNKYDINISNLSLTIFDLDTSEKMIYSTDKWLDEAVFDIDKLYRLYIHSCYKEDDFNFNKHAGGYHFINKSIKSFNNREKKYREQYDLDTYAPDYMYDTDYRDVRNFRYEEVIQKSGLLDDIDIYKHRRLRFESYLYCVLRQEMKSNNKTFNEKLHSLYNGKDYIKYGSNIKLIFKRYWLNNIDSSINKTWSRVK